MVLGDLENVCSIEESVCDSVVKSAWTCARICARKNRINYKKWVKIGNF